MMKLRRILSVLLIIVLIFVAIYGVSLLVVRNSGYHQYPTLDELRQLEGPEAKHEACKIPKIKLKLMSNDQLVQALLDDPYLMTTHIYSTGRLGTDAIVSQSSALQELLERDGSANLLLEKIEELRHDPDPYVREGIVESLAVILLYDHTLASQLTPAEKEMLHPFDSFRRGPPDYPGYFD